MATKGKKNAKVKWAIGGTEPDDLPDFVSNDDIMRKNKGALPPKGRTRVLIKKVTSKDNKNGDQMLTVTCEIAEKGSKKEQAFNGYAMWERLNVTEQGAPYLKRFLTAIGVTWNDFITKTIADESDDKATVITKIGKVKFGTDKPPEAWVSVKHGVDQNDEETADVGRFLPPPEEDEDADDEDAEDEEEDEDGIEVDDDDDSEEEDADDDDDDDEDDEDEDEDDDEDEEEEDDDDAEETLRAELKPLKVAALKKRAIRAGLDEDDIPSKKQELIEAIISAELEEGDEDEDEDEEDEEDGEAEQDPEELKAELKLLDLTTLRNRARANGRKASALKGAKKPALIKFILEDEIPPF